MSGMGLILKMKCSRWEHVHRDAHSFFCGVHGLHKCSFKLDNCVHAVTELNCFPVALGNLHTCL